MPVTMPAPGASPPYFPQAASVDSSRNGECSSMTAIDTLAHHQLAATPVALDLRRAIAFEDESLAFAQRRQQLLEASAVVPEGL